MMQDERSWSSRAGIIGRLVRAIRRVFFGASRSRARFILPADDPPHDDLAGSGVPRRPPSQSGSGSVALVEPVPAEERFGRC